MVQGTQGWPERLWRLWNGIIDSLSSRLRVGIYDADGNSAEVGKPVSGSSRDALYIVADQLEETNMLLDKLRQQNKLMLVHMTIITGLDIDDDD